MSELTVLGASFVFVEYPKQLLVKSMRGILNLTKRDVDQHAQRKVTRVDSKTYGAMARAKVEQRQINNNDSDEESEKIRTEMAPKDKLRLMEDAKQRRQSTDTLQRLSLVAFELENHLKIMRRSNSRGPQKYIFTIRFVNTVVLTTMTALVLTGLGQYKSGQGQQTIVISVGKWSGGGQDLPQSFGPIQLVGQYIALFICIVLCFSTYGLQITHLCKFQCSTIVNMAYAFSCAPFSLLIFGLEMHYSSCPWLADFYRSQIMVQNEHRVDLLDGSHDPYLKATCSVGGWTLAALFALFSCGFFVSDGLIHALNRPPSDENHKTRTDDV